MNASLIRAVLTTLLGLNLTGQAAQSEDRYYMAILGAQGPTNLPRQAHSAGVFVRVATENPGDEPKLEIQCISWVPRSGIVSILRRPEVGMNLNLEESIRFSRDRGSSVTMWGPYRISRELYAMAARQRERLDGNDFLYVCYDAGFRGSASTNCIHALSDLDSTQGLLQTGTARGYGASLMVLRHFERHILASDEDMTWLTDKLRLNPNEVRFATTSVRRSEPTTPSEAVANGYRDFWTGIVWPPAPSVVTGTETRDNRSNLASSKLGYVNFWEGVRWPNRNRQ